MAIFSTQLSSVFRYAGVAAVLMLAAQNGLADTHPEPIGAIVRDHCVQCHGQNGEVNGDVDLLPFVGSVSELGNQSWLPDLIRVVESGEMPPPDESVIEAEDRAKLAGALKQLLSQASAERVGHAPVRRMNRFQYDNAVRDLFQLNCVVFSLPERMMREHKGYFDPASGVMPDTVMVGSRPLGKSQMIEPRLQGVAPFPQDLRAEHGFDNRGDHLSLSPLLMEAFLTLGQSVTQSPDFTAKRVGIWAEFFADPNLSDDAQRREVVRQRLAPFLTSAFRRPCDDAMLDRYAKFVDAQINAGLGFTEAMKSVAAATIASPRFLYIYDEASDKEGPEPLDDFELATRLSFFLWGSLPDEELLRLASQHRLTEPDVLVGQVDRMLSDKKLKRFCDSFPAQWLQLERIVSANPDPERFPKFYYAKYRNSMHMMVEPLLLFETVLIENLPITQFIDSDFTYRSMLLRDAYREDVSPQDRKQGRGNDVMALTFRRLPVTDRRQGGVITNAAVMTMTSGPQRTQPITRGSWLLTVIFNEPPKPPPADVPPLSEEPKADEAQMTLRERLALHRERADCRGCHEKIDPLGFALENYDPIGVWREKYENGRDVDMADTLFHEHSFQNVIEFKDALLAEKDRFTQGFTRHLLSFALARELESSDVTAVQEIAAAAAADDYRIGTLIRNVVLSKPFRMKMNPSHHQDNHDQREN
ncbi:DUF1592 domain-containing protein [Rubripirellula lacrimiformis]|uniref:DUF1592 domain-containing protein n=1 Tax=Rubripirellula lacrimiformis TaxID=1930273 RepID=UPI001FE43435|nr:DUF1592 domain-containing protein [Rubripirellula lacrimiformis]